MGWRVLIIWGCSMRGKYSHELFDVLEKTEKWLLSNKKFAEISENSN
jgi:G:T-mismatch repair DNA endonuclease (very short patch repair protein)